jgi:ferredoxin
MKRESDNLEVSVNSSCIGCSVCATEAPNTFEMCDRDDGTTVAKVKPNFSDSKETIAEAKESCPVEAIEVNDA